VSPRHHPAKGDQKTSRLVSFEGSIAAPNTAGIAPDAAALALLKLLLIGP
jgi:hypothetical protein